ncbi:hypothetical protein HK105_207290 [Polyrhizophydium stewartii]|uniref:HMG box domain-containing protein n=1 Tax=Polyrhizophydium stewartii TaxID=2732419 RepID=A0ABR4N148_9FUNG
MPKETKAKVAKKTAGGKSNRPLTPYNAFMKAELPKIKAAQPELSHRDAFKLCASKWKDAPENPANKK